METRVCKKCGCERPLIKFRTINEDCYRSYTCNVCVYQDQKKKGLHSYHKKNPEKWNAYQRYYRRYTYWLKKLAIEPNNAKAQKKLNDLIEAKKNLFK